MTTNQLYTNPSKKSVLRTNTVRIGVFNNLDLIQFAGCSTKMQTHPLFNKQMVSFNETTHGCTMEFIDHVSPELPVILLRYDALAEFKKNHQNLLNKVVTGVPGEPSHADLKSYPNCVNMRKKPEIYAKIYEMMADRTVNVNKYQVGVLGSETDLSSMQKLFSEKFETL